MEWESRCSDRSDERTAGASVEQRQSASSETTRRAGRGGRLSQFSPKQAATFLYLGNLNNARRGFGDGDDDFL